MASLSSISRHLTTNPGGMLTFYVALVGEVSTIPAASNQVVSSNITMLDSNVFVKWDFVENTGKLTDTKIGGGGDHAGWRKRIEFKVAKTRATMDAVFNNATGGRFIVLIKDQNDSVRILGDIDRPARIVAADGDTGADAEDDNIYNLAFECEANHPCNYYTGDIPITTTTYDADAQDYFDRAGITDTTERAAVDAFVLACKSNSIWTKLAGGLVNLVSPSSFGASLHNLMSSDFTLTYDVGKSPLWSTTGWEFNGVDQFMKSGWNPLTEHTAGEGYNGVYIGTNQDDGFDFGSRNTSGTEQWSISSRASPDLIKFNTSGAGYQSLTTTDCTGYTSFIQAASNDKRILKNGSSIGTDSTTTGTLPNFEFFIGCLNLNGTASAFTSKEMRAVIFLPNKLTDAEDAILYGLLQTYQQNVISGGREI